MFLLKLLQDIFVLEIKDRAQTQPVVQDKTEHYREELWTLSLDTIFIGSSYSEWIADDIEKYKFYSYKEYEDYLLPFYRAIFEKEKERIDLKEYVITTVPMYWTRYVVRGFDHMHYLAKRIAEEYGIPYMRLLSRKRHTKHQSSLLREKRLENIKDSFTMTYEFQKIRTRRILLLDDIISTGATANEAAKVLKEHWCFEVRGYFIASWK